MTSTAPEQTRQGKTRGQRQENAGGGDRPSANRTKPLLILLLSGIVIALGSVGSPRPATADQAPQSEPTVEERFAAGIAWQESIREYKDALLTAAHADAGYAGAELDPARHSMTLFGVGEPSAELETLMKEAPANLAITWTRAPYNEEQLDDAVAAAMQQPGAMAADIRADFSGVNARALPTSTSARAAGLPSRIGADDVPVEWTIIDQPPAVPAQDTRQSGPPPFLAGSMIRRTDGIHTQCTTGPAVVTPAGNRIMLTAHHCTGGKLAGGVVGQTWQLNSSRHTVGKSMSSPSSQQWDVQGIDGGGVDQYSRRKFWAGGTSGVALEFVGGAGELVNGEQVVISGAFSGGQLAEVENADAAFRFCRDNDNSFCDSHGHFVYVADYNHDGTAIGGGGDSGAVVFQGNRLAGVYSAYDPNFAEPCEGIGGGRECSSRGYFSPWWRFKQTTAGGLELP